MVELQYCPVCCSYLYDGVTDLDQPLCLALPSPRGIILLFPRPPINR